MSHKLCVISNELLVISNCYYVTGIIPYFYFYFYNRNHEPLLQTIKRRKLKWYGHISIHEGLCKTIMQGIVEGVRKRGRPSNG